jgi:hypothetical protein
MDNTKRVKMLLAVLFTTAAILPAQTAADPSGHWEGLLQTPTREMVFDIDLARNGRGELVGAFGQPSENLRGLSLSDIAVEGQSVRFQIKGTPGERVFKGILSADGKSISGEYTQNGGSIPFEMSRRGDPRLEAPVRNAPIGKELEGIWRGTTGVNGNQLHAVLTLLNQSDGSATGSIVTVEDGLEIPIARITQNASRVALDLKAVGGSYSGALNPDATELAGTYTKGSLVLPLTFLRSADGKK